MPVWGISIVLSIAALVGTAAARAGNVQMAYAHMGLAALASVLFAAIAIRDCRQLLASGAKYAEVAATNARSFGFVWAWGALVLLITYGAGVLSWREWWQYTIPFAAAAGLSLLFSRTLQKEAQGDTEDRGLLKLGRYLAIIQLAGMVVAMAGLLIDGKMTRFLNVRYTDWAANNVFFFGALAIALISAFALHANRPR
jgi:hypothetical protein